LLSEKEEEEERIRNLVEKKKYINSFSSQFCFVQNSRALLLSLEQLKTNLVPKVALLCSVCSYAIKVKPRFLDLKAYEPHKGSDDCS